MKNVQRKKTIESLKWNKSIYELSALATFSRDNKIVLFAWSENLEDPLTQRGDEKTILEDEEMWELARSQFACFDLQYWSLTCLLSEKKKQGFNGSFPTESEWYLNIWVHFQFTYETFRSFCSTEAQTFHQTFKIRFRFSKAFLFSFNMADAIKQILHRTQDRGMHMNKCIILMSHREWFVSRRYRDDSSVRMTRSRLHMMITWDQSTCIEMCIGCFQRQLAVENSWSILKD